MRVLSGGERTRLAVARMLLRPSNTLLLDEPTNHLDLDSKDVLLDALEDFGGTLIFVSHDRYFVDKLATKIVEIGGGGALVYPGTYEEFLWSRKQREAGSRARRRAAAPAAPKPAAHREPAVDRPAPAAPRGRTARARTRRRRQRPAAARRTRTASGRRRRRAASGRRPTRGASGSKSSRAGSPTASRRSRTSRPAMAAPGFYENHETAKPVVDRHQALMWEVGDLMSQWEALQQQTES